MRLPLLALCLLFACATLCIAETSQVQVQEQQEPARSAFTLPKLFDFERFKQLFNKSYSSCVDELNRKRLFLAQAFQVFVSAVNYKYRRASSYLGINEMSDWTEEEWTATLMRPDDVERYLKAVRESGLTADHYGDQLTPVAEGEMTADSNEDLIEVRLDDISDTADIERKMAELRERYPEEPVVEQLAIELVAHASARRRKRETTTLQSPRELSFDSLMSEQNSRAAPDYGERVASNNPDYQMPEVTSFGWLLPEKPLLPMTNNYRYISALIGGKMKGYQFKLAPGSENLPDEVFVNHYDGGCVFPARNQRRCGSCYIFATIAYYEWAYCKATGHKVAFSEQYVLDCGRRAVSSFGGCEGGIDTDVNVFSTRCGLELSRHYPYSAYEYTCPYEKPVKRAAMGYLRVQDEGFEYVHLRDFPEALKEGPLVVSFYTNKYFGRYKGGVDSSNDCSGGGHAVLLVGHGREEGEEYWLIKNSHGRTWGEDGFYKLNKRVSGCLMAGVGTRLRNFRVPEEFELRDPSKQVAKRFNYIYNTNKE